VLAPTEGASKRTPYYLKSNLVSFNTWSATYALTHILEGRYSADKYHLAILDRGLFDALAWFELLKAENNVTEEECTTVQNFLLVNHWREVIDIVFLFVTDPDTSLEREARDKLIGEPGQAMNPEFLKKLNAAYEDVKESYSDRFSQVRVLDTSKSQDTTPQSTAFEVASQILDLLPHHKA
jgi:thymidylate kinase